MKKNLSVLRVLTVALTASLGLTACGHRFVSARSTNPLIEDSVPLAGARQNMSVLTSRADRRTILVFGERKVCAEPPPDVAEAIYSQTAANLDAKEISGGFNSVLKTALMQLTRRSQGLDFYRTGSFVNCMMHYNGTYSPSEYRDAMKDLLVRSEALTIAEMKHLPAIASAVMQATDPTFKLPNASADKGEEPESATETPEEKTLEGKKPK